jgi:hypothetical protein
MSWASQGSAGVGSVRANGTTLVQTLAVTIPVGTRLVTCISYDNISAAGLDGVIQVVDSKGNTWQKLEYHSQALPAGDTAGISIWVSNISTQLVSGDTITVTFSASILSKCMTTWRFTTTEASSTPIGVQSEDTLALPGPMTVDPIFVGDLVIRATAQETNTAANWVPTPGWTAFSPANTSGQGAATNVIVRGEWKIADATSETSQPSGASSATGGSIMFAVHEDVPPVPPVTTNPAFLDFC